MVTMLLVGSDYRVVAPSRLEELSSRKEQIQARLLELQSAGEIAGALLLSTCNRVEVILDIDKDAPPGLGRRALGCAEDFPVREFTGVDAIVHMLAIATGLHSMVFGEEQILGQVRRAFKTAEEFGLLSRNLHMLRTRLLAAARDLRHRTGLDRRPGSMAAMAVDQVVRAGNRIAVIGAGETARLALEVMRRRHVAEPLVVNRTLAKAEALARHFGGRAMSLREFLANPPAVDGILCAVHSPEPFLGPEHTKGLKMVVDISQPSVLKSSLRGVPGLMVCDLDEIAHLSGGRNDRYIAIRETGTAEVNALAKQIWSDLSPQRASLGRVVDLHVEGAMAELENALNGNLSHLASDDREKVRAILLRTAKRNAHYHIKDIRQLARA